LRNKVLSFILLFMLSTPVVFADYQDTGLEIAKGNVPGHSLVGFEGIDENVGTTEYVIWEENIEYVYPVAATLMNISSSSVNDTLGGSGAWNVTINGLDANYTEISETVTLNGQTPVSTTQQFFRVNRMVIHSVGAAGGNVGTIYIGVGAVVAGKPVTIYNEITPGWGISSTAIYTVPDGYTAYLKYFHLGSDTAKILDVTLRSRCLTGCMNNGWRVDYHTRFLEPGPTHNLPLPFPYSEHTDIQVTAVSNVGDAFTTCDVFFVLVEDGYEYIYDESQSTNNTLLYLVVMVLIVSVAIGGRRR